MAVLLKGSPTATSMDSAQPDDSGGLDPGEQAASPYEEHLLDKVMGAVFHSLNDAKKLRVIESWLMKSKNLGIDVGHIAFKLLATIFQSAKSGGVQIPVDIFFAQGGAVQQTIDRILMIAEHSGVPGINQDQVREDAMGVVVDSVKKMFGNLMDDKPGQQGQQGQQPGQQQQVPQAMPGHPQMMGANPMAHAVGRGLQSQGLLGGQNG